MTYTKSSPEWQDIMRENRWFLPETMEYWNCTVLWDTLTPVGNGEWLFLSLDDNYNRTERMYSVRMFSTNDRHMSTLSFQQTSDKSEALAMFNEHSFELGSRC
jgi:hypothetical protein